MECPEHKVAYLYKELLEDGKAILHCLSPGCEWKSEPTDRHLHIEELGEKKREYNGV